MYNPVKTIKTNTVGTVNMLGLAKRVSARILIASTSEVYGDPEVSWNSRDIKNSMKDLASVFRIENGVESVFNSVS